MKLKWYGHSCFALTYADGTAIVIDPFDASVGYPLCKARADAGSSPVTSTTRRMAHAPCHPSLFVVTGLTHDKTGFPKIAAQRDFWEKEVPPGRSRPVWASLRARAAENP